LRQVGYLQRLYRDVRSTKHKISNKLGNVRVALKSEAFTHLLFPNLKKRQINALYIKFVFNPYLQLMLELLH